MSYDSWLVVEQSKRWHNAHFVSLPSDPLQPVMWISADERLCVYHPALEMDPKGITPPFSWDDLSFRKIVRDIRRKAHGVVSRKLEDRGIPASFYSSYVETCRLVAQGAFADT